jgi:hypothetical protein
MECDVFIVLHRENGDRGDDYKEDEAINNAHAMTPLMSLKESRTWDLLQRAAETFLPCGRSIKVTCRARQ